MLLHNMSSNSMGNVEIETEIPGKSAIKLYEMKPLRAKEQFKKQMDELYIKGGIKEKKKKNCLKKKKL